MILFMCLLIALTFRYKTKSLNHFILNSTNVVGMKRF